MTHRQGESRGNRKADRGGQSQTPDDHELNDQGDIRRRSRMSEIADGSRRNQDGGNRNTKRKSSDDRQDIDLRGNQRNR